jgi:hypothetical protein
MEHEPRHYRASPLGFKAHLWTLSGPVLLAGLNPAILDTGARVPGHNQTPGSHMATCPFGVESRAFRARERRTSRKHAPSPAGGHMCSPLTPVARPNGADARYWAVAQVWSGRRLALHGGCF